MNFFVPLTEAEVDALRSIPLLLTVVVSLMMPFSDESGLVGSFLVIAADSRMAATSDFTALMIFTSS